MFGIYSDFPPLHSLLGFVNQLFVEDDDVLSLVILNEIHVLQRGHDVFLLNRRQLADVVGRDLWRLRGGG